LVIYQESLNDARSTKYKKKINYNRQPFISILGLP